MFCTKCGASIKDGNNFCTSCGSSIGNSNNKDNGDNNYYEGRIVNTTNKVVDINKTSVPITQDNSNEIIEIQRKQLKLQEQQMKSMAMCPKCGSTSLSGNKKGFGIGKAVVGGFVAGPIGLVAGNIGAKNVQVTCLNCGKKFKA